MINWITSFLRVLWNFIFNILSITKTPIGALIVISLILVIIFIVLKKKKRSKDFLGNY